MAKRRRRFTDEFKLEAVKMVIEQGRPVREVAESLGVSETGLVLGSSAVGKQIVSSFTMAS